MISLQKDLKKFQSSAMISICMLIFISMISFAQDEQHRELYNNKEMFDQLSSAAQNLFRIKFGPRPGEKPSSGPTFSPQETSRIEQSPMSALLNTLVNNPTADATAQDTQSETAIILGSGSNIIGSFNDSGSNIGGASKFTGFSTSADGGNTWNDGGTLPTSATGDVGDPVLARDNVSGDIYLATLQFSGNGLGVFKSTNNGATWGAPTQGAPGATGFQDKEWIAVDNFSGAGQRNVYMAYRDFAAGGGMRFTRSTDFGATFSPSPGLLLKTGGQGAYVVVSPDHSVNYFWYDSGTPRTIKTRKSTDQGVTFAAEITVTNLTSTGTNGDLTLPAGFRSSSFPSVGVNSVSGHLYVVYNDPTAASGGDRGNIKFVKSTDGGATWSTPMIINDDVTTRAQYIPSIAVKPDGSGLAVTWYDNRNDPANLNIERWGVTATISGSTVTFGSNFRISPQFTPVFGVDPSVNATYMGDYDMMASDNTYFHTLWGDNRDNATFPGATRKNANVRHAKFTINGPGAIPTFISASVSGGNGNGIIDFNECNDITISIGNDGNQTATSVSAVLSTSTPGVKVTQHTSAYPNVAARGTGTNSTVFKVSTSSSFVCGTTINFSLTINYTGGTEVYNFQLPSGSAGTASNFNNNTPTPIVDNSTTNIPISVSGFTGSIGKVTLSFHATHTWDEDLDIFLIAPDGTTVELSTDNGGSGDNYGSSCAARTTFDDDAATSITAGTPPFAGTFRPEGLLASFKGKSGVQVNGSWTLRIIDDVATDAGTFQCATLSISPLACTDGGGECSTNMGVTVIPEGFYDSGLNRLNMKDTVKVYLRNISSPYTKIDSAKAVIDSLTFTGNFTFKKATTGTYYIVVNHRNSIETWSKSGGESILGGNIFNYNFTDAQNKAYGNNMIQKGTKWCIFSGDINQDGAIDALDRSIAWTDRNLTGYVVADVNGDGIVDALDRSICWTNRNILILRP